MSQLRKLLALLVVVAVTAGFYATISFTSWAIEALPLEVLRLGGKELALAQGVTRSLLGMTIFVASLCALLMIGGQRDRILDSLKAAPRAGWIAAAITAAIHITVTLSLFVKDPSRVFELSLFNAYVSIATALGGGVFEEIVHRTFVIVVLISAGYSKWPAISISAVLFSVNHVGWIDPAGLDIASIAIQLSPLWGTLILGFALGFTFTESKLRVWPVIAAHAAINLTIEPWLLLTLTNTS